MVDDKGDTRAPLRLAGDPTDVFINLAADHPLPLPSTTDVKSFKKNIKT